jgi:hypothetical protein
MSNAASKAIGGQRRDLQFVAGGSMKTLIETLNDRCDMTDAEWTCAMYTFGFRDGRRRRG